MKHLNKVLFILIASNLVVSLINSNVFYVRISELETRLNALEQKDVDSQCIQWWIGAADLEAARKRLCTKK